MESTDISSQEKLEQMLQSGKISEDEYQRLASALQKKPSSGSEEEPQAREHRKLYKSWKHRQLGGVCGGLADYFGIDPLIVRIIFVILGLLALPVAIIVYLITMFLLPWDDKEAACEPQQRGPFYRLIFWGVILLTLMPWAFSQFLLPRFMRIYEEMGTALPDWAQLCIFISDAYRADFSYGHFPWAIPLSLVVVLLATLFSLVIHNRKARLVYCLLFFFVSALWTLFLTAGNCLSLYLSISQVR